LAMEPDQTLKDIANLKFSTIKESNEYDSLYCIELTSALNKKSLVFQADTESQMQEWIITVRNLTEKLLFTDNMYGSDSIKSPIELKRDSSTNSGHSEKGKSKETLVNSIIDNNKCADCGNEKPSWISLNLCAIVCLECSGIHRSLGPHISKIRSLKLDNLNSGILAIYSTLTYEQCNRVWEATASGFIGLKPKPDSPLIEKEKWIKMKYVDKLFVKAIHGENISTLLVEAFKNSDLSRILQILALNKVNLQESSIIDGKKRTYLHIACMYSKKHVIEYLLLNGAKLDILDQDSCKPLDMAMIMNNLEAVDYIVKRMDDLEC